MKTQSTYLCLGILSQNQLPPPDLYAKVRMELQTCHGSFLKQNSLSSMPQAFDCGVHLPLVVESYQVIWKFLIGIIIHHPLLAKGQSIDIMGGR